MKPWDTNTNILISGGKWIKKRQNIISLKYWRVFISRKIWPGKILFSPQGVLPRCLESFQILWERLFCEQPVYNWERLFREQPVYNWEVPLTLDTFVYLPLRYLILFAHMCYIPRKRIPGFSLLWVCFFFFFWTFMFRLGLVCNWKTLKSPRLTFFSSHVEYDSTRSIWISLILTYLHLTFCLQPLKPNFYWVDCFFFFFNGGKFCTV